MNALKLTVNTLTPYSLFHVKSILLKYRDKLHLCSNTYTLHCLYSQIVCQYVSEVKC